MQTKYKDIGTVDLERIYSFKKSEINFKEQLNLDRPNQELNRQIQGLKEIVFDIEQELLLSRT